MHPDIKVRLLHAGLKLAENGGYQNVTRYTVAAECGVSPGCVSYHWKDMEKLRLAIVREAITSENVVVIAQAIGLRHPILERELPPELRRRVLQKLAAH